jgi:pimeloyl-ACP methyl ester carboxylesterase
MGAAAIAFAGPACGWNGVVLEGIYAEVAQAFQRRIGTAYPRWFGRLYPGVMWITQKRIKVSSLDLRPVEAVRSMASVPSLLITGEQDKFAPPDDAQRVAAAAGPLAETWFVPGAGHGDVVDTGGPAYRERLLGFLTKVVRN